MTTHRDITPDEYWSQLSDSEKKLFLDYCLTTQEKPWIPRPSLVHLPKEIIGLISSYFSKDPTSFFNLKATCKYVRDAVPKFEDIIDPSTLNVFVYRLINRVNKKSGSLSLRIQAHKTFGEKCRYIEISADCGKICCIDKATGLILDGNHARPRGYVYDDAPETYFENGRLLSMLAMGRQHIGFDERKQELEKVLKESTLDLKRTKGYEKKKIFASNWNEDGYRPAIYKPAKTMIKKRFLPYNK